jgi:putative two-component system response regulator
MINDIKHIPLPYPETELNILSDSWEKLITDIQEKTAALVDFPEDLQKELLIQILENTVNTVKYKHEETNGHMTRIWILSKFIWQLVSESEWTDVLEKHFIEYLWFTAPLHDIWKLWIPLDVLQKPWKLNAEEYKIIQTHAEIWWQVIESIRNIIGRGPILAMAQNIALYHHEKYDGTGYPYGLKWKAIPLAARIVWIIDVIDVLKSKRVYKTECMSDQQVKNILIECSWNHFDPEIINIILEHLEQILRLRDTLRD